MKFRVILATCIVAFAVSSAPSLATPAVDAAHNPTHAQLARACKSRRCKRKFCHSTSCKARIARKAKVRYVQPYEGWLYRTRMCESHGFYGTNTGNGFYGAYQFTIQSWHGVGGYGRPDLNPAYEQDYRAVLLLQRGGPGNWPVCGH